MERGILIAPVGCSGSGKSRLRAELLKKYPDTKIVCPDDIRREKWGNVSDQKNGGVVFLIAFSMIEKALSQGKLCFMDATNLGKSLDELCKKFKPVVPVFIEDSKDPNLCYSRIANDLSSGKDRSNVPYDVVVRQHDKYVKMNPDDYDYSIVYSSDDAIEDLFDLIETLDES